LDKGKKRGVIFNVYKKNYDHFEFNN